MKTNTEWEIVKERSRRKLFQLILKNALQLVIFKNHFRPTIFQFRQFLGLSLHPEILNVRRSVVNINIDMDKEKGDELALGQ